MLRALALAALVFAVALAISAASDEGGVRFATRLGRTLPLAPICGAIAAWLTLASERAKIEALALESIGRAPALNNAGAVFGGALFALAAASLVAFSSHIDVEAIFPSFSSAPRIEWNGNVFIDSSHGVSFAANGEAQSLPDATKNADVQMPIAAAPAHERGGASVALAFAAIAFPLFAASAIRRVSAAIVVAIAASAFLTFLAFDAVASSRAPPSVQTFVLALPQAALLFLAILEYRRSGCLVPK
ncbi:MAG: hypothetical protein ABI421_06765 [Polyangiaceae bacterium]